MGDYDRKPMQKAGIYLKLKSKDESVRIRIASPPYRELQVWPAEQGGRPVDRQQVAQFTPGQWSNVMRNPEWSIAEVFHYLVIDRFDGAAKIFTTTGGVYGKLRDYAQNPEWGDPKYYDITITRTENPGKNYYEVTPSPNKSELQATELDRIDAINMREQIPSAIPNSAPQPDENVMAIEPEPMPWEPLTTKAPLPTAERTDPQPPLDPAPKQDDIVIEDPGDPINLDDIPF